MGRSRKWWISCDEGGTQRISQDCQTEIDLDDALNHRGVLIEEAIQGIWHQ